MLMAEPVADLSSASRGRCLLFRSRFGRRLQPAPSGRKDRTVGGWRGRRQREDFDASVDGAVALSQARDHPRRERRNDWARPMRANARAILIEALGDAHRWLDELLSDPRQTLETLASREGKTERSIRMTVSLAFLAQDIVKAAVEGCLPRGYGLKRLIDLPAAWPD